jgi:hypothetical protein
MRKQSACTWQTISETAAPIFLQGHAQCQYNIKFWFKVHCITEDKRSEVGFE